MIQYDGSFWMTYERVSEQKVIHHPPSEKHPNGWTEYLPWVTEIFQKRMKNGTEAYKKGDRLPDGRIVGDEILSVSVRPEYPTDDQGNPLFPTPTPYPSTNRHGLGDLVEGGNIYPEPVWIEDDYYWVMFVSVSNYVFGLSSKRDYGIRLATRKASMGPIGRYHYSLDEGGDIANFSKSFAAAHLLTWVGRADLSYLKGSGYWLTAHGVRAKTVPPGLKLSNWPKKDEFEKYFREQILLPIRFTKWRGQPWLQIEHQF